MGNSLCSGTHSLAASAAVENGIDGIDVGGLIVTAQARAFPFAVGLEQLQGVDSTSGGACPPPLQSVSMLGQSGGECFLLVERCLNVPSRSASSTLGACGGAPDRGRPRVRAWAQDSGGAVLGHVAEWPARANSSSPTWFSARPLGISISKTPDASLRIELLDDDMLIGSLTAPLGELPGHSDVKREFCMEAGKAVDKPCSITFQVLDTRAVHAGRRTVYFVRHGESVWNAAQSNANLHEMARTLDHPLSLKGHKQAEALREKVEHGLRAGDMYAQQLSEPGVLYVSPLCRAMQTAIIGLGPFQAEAGGELVLMAAAREKQNLGGLDSMSNKRGTEILHNTLEELTKAYKTSGEGLKEAIDMFGKLRFDVHEAEEQWWCEGASDSAEQLHARLQDFMAQILYTPHQTAVVVGHSHFFRSAFKAFLSKEFHQRNPQLAKDITSKKLMNCGVARVELDPRLGVEGGPIVNVELVLGTTLHADGAAMLAACCHAPGHTETIGLGGNTLLVDAEAGGKSSANLPDKIPELPLVDCSGTAKVEAL